MHNVSIEILDELNISSEFINPLSIIEKIRVYLKDKLSNVSNAFNHTTMNSDIEFSQSEFQAFIKDGNSLPDINVTIPNHCNTTLPLLINEQSQLLSIINILTVYDDLNKMSTKLLTILTKKNIIDQDFDNLVKTNNILNTNYLKKLDIFTNEVDSYFKENYNSSIRNNTDSCIHQFTNKQTLNNSVEMMSKNISIYKSTINRLKLSTVTGYKNINSIINMLEKIESVPKSFITIFYTLIMSLSNTTESYGKLLGDVQNVEFHMVNNIKTILMLNQ